MPKNRYRQTPAFSSPDEGRAAQHGYPTWHAAFIASVPLGTGGSHDHHLPGELPADSHDDPERL